MEILYVLLAVVGVGLLSWVSSYVRTNYLTKQRLDQLQQAEWLAERYVRAAEQKFNLVLDVAEKVVTPEQAILIKHQRDSYNKDKKAYALGLLKASFPELDTEILDGLIEGAVNFYKQTKKEVVKDQKATFTIGNENLVIKSN